MWAKAILNLVKNVQKAGEFKRILITGHADSAGPDEFNYNLGLRRAIQVKRFLVESGLALETQISTASSGEKHPISYGEIDRELEKDRRVHLHFVN